MHAQTLKRAAIFLLLAGCVISPAPAMAQTDPAIGFSRPAPGRPAAAPSQPSAKPPEPAAKPVEPAFTVSKPAIPAPSGPAAQAGAPATPTAPASPAVDAEAPPPACAPKVALYTGQKGTKILVKRLGRGNAADPLRPLTPRPVTVLELSNEGRLSYVAGPNLLNLKRTGLAELEEDQPVAWAAADQPVPKTIRLVTDDGISAFGELAFTRCEDPPAPRRPAASRAGQDRGRGEQKPARKLPQGALPENSLKLQQ